MEILKNTSHKSPVWRCCWSSARRLEIGQKPTFGVVFYLLALLAVGIISDIKLTHAESSVAQEYQIKAAFIYKFCSYTEWPDEAFDDVDSPLVLGVAGPEILAAELERIVRGRSCHDRPVRVLHIRRDRLVRDVHLLFIARSEYRRMEYLLSLVRGRPVLLITDSPLGLDAGSVIDFVVENNRVRFDINRSSAEKQGLRLSAQLLKVARRVENGKSQ